MSLFLKKPNGLFNTLWKKKLCGIYQIYSNKHPGNLFHFLTFSVRALISFFDFQCLFWGRCLLNFYQFQLNIFSQFKFHQQHKKERTKYKDNKKYSKLCIGSVSLTTIQNNKLTFLRRSQTLVKHLQCLVVSHLGEGVLFEFYHLQGGWLLTGQLLEVSTFSRLGVLIFK